MAVARYLAGAQTAEDIVAALKPGAPVERIQGVEPGASVSGGATRLTLPQPDRSSPAVRAGDVGGRGTAAAGPPGITLSRGSMPRAARRRPRPARRAATVRA
jgi:hypothetical protein